MWRGKIGFYCLSICWQLNQQKHAHTHTHTTSLSQSSNNATPLLACLLPCRPTKTTHMCDFHVDRPPLTPCHADNMQATYGQTETNMIIPTYSPLTSCRLLPYRNAHNKQREGAQIGGLCAPLFLNVSNITCSPQAQKAAFKTKTHLEAPAHSQKMFWYQHSFSVPVPDFRFLAGSSCSESENVL